MRTPKRLLVTGGAGFIGSCFIRFLLKQNGVERVVNLDLLTYAASLRNVEECEGDPRYFFVQGDILDRSLVERLLAENQIDTVVHFAAETHVDRSILSAHPFIQVNVMGTLSLLEAVRKWPHIHFHQISTDEVFGALGAEGCFTESSPYRPNSPYSASKAGADHLVRAFANTYQVSTTISHASNNYGPGQYREKLIPLMIHNCLAKAPLPVYGRGNQVRDWLYVEDHAAALWLVLQRGERGATYSIGGGTELSNLSLIYLLIELLAEITKTPQTTYLDLIHFVPDRLGHDFRYAVDTTKVRRLGWEPKIGIRQGLKETISAYLALESLNLR